MPFRVTKALITAAGPAQRRLPLQNLTDRDGAQKPALALLLDEMLAAGIEQVGLVHARGDRAAYEAVLAPYAAKLTFLEQPAPLGYGHAVLCGREFVGNQPFLLQVSDHLYVSHAAKSCTRQLLDLAEAENCAVSAVQPTHESQLQYYGTIGGSLVPGRRGLTAVERVLEKPTPTVAEQQCLVPGLRAGYYLCFFGMHVLTPALLELLAAARQADPAAKLGLSPALDALAAREKYLAAVLDGRRANLEAHFGLLRAQIALGLSGANRGDVLALLAEELALANERPVSRNGAEEPKG
jgi:UTP--glucose-1-phosphate uridylyltransferase